MALDKESSLHEEEVENPEDNLIKLLSVSNKSKLREDLERLKQETEETSTSAEETKKAPLKNSKSTTTTTTNSEKIASNNNDSTEKEIKISKKVTFKKHGNENSDKNDDDDNNGNDNDDDNDIKDNEDGDDEDDEERNLFFIETKSNISLLVFKDQIYSEKEKIQLLEKQIEEKKARIWKNHINSAQKIHTISCKGNYAECNCPDNNAGNSNGKPKLENAMDEDKIQHDDKINGASSTATSSTASNENVEKITNLIEIIKDRDNSVCKELLYTVFEDIIALDFSKLPHHNLIDFSVVLDYYYLVIIFTLLDTQSVYNIYKEGQLEKDDFFYRMYKCNEKIEEMHRHNVEALIYRLEGTKMGECFAQPHNTVGVVG